MQLESTCATMSAAERTNALLDAMLADNPDTAQDARWEEINRLHVTALSQSEREWHINLRPPRARVCRIVHAYDGVATIAATNWEELEPAARDAVVRQIGSLDMEGFYGCPDELVAQARYEEVPEDDWIMLVDALEILRDRGIAYTFQGLHHAITRGELDWLSLPHAPRQRGRRKVRRSQITRLQLHRQRG